MHEKTEWANIDFQFQEAEFQYFSVCHISQINISLDAK